MQQVIDTIIRQLNPVMIRAESDKIRDIQLDVRDIKGSVAALKDQLNVWEKLNPFSHSEEKKELKYLRDELKFYKNELKIIKDGLRAEIRSIIEASPPLRMKATVSEMEDAMDRLQSRLKRGGNKNASHLNKYAEIRSMRDNIRELDILIQNQFGFEKGLFREHEMVEAVLQEVLNSRMS